MFRGLPKDPVMLLSVINTKLRDHYPSLEALCEDLQIDKGELSGVLGTIDYVYDCGRNQFV